MIYSSHWRYLLTHQVEFVEVPEQFRDRLSYSLLLCGVLRGALEMVVAHIALVSIVLWCLEFSCAHDL